ncbi:MAG: isocitrate lyase/phosphoenolpyruvate mutase family protein [Terricaulis sp.]
MPARPADAAPFHALHKELLLLPNAWDAASARVVQEAGAKAIATSSAAVAWAHGFPDGHGLPPAKLAIVVEEIARVVSVPITVDSEGGYSDDPAEVEKNIASFLNAGGVGINLEDGRDPHELHLRKIEAALRAGKRTGVKIFINARTDVYLKQLVPAKQAVAETLKRAAAIKAAGASGLFVTGVFESAEIKTIVESCGLPLNVMARPGVPDATGLRALGVKRLSAATSPFAAAMNETRALAEEFLAAGNSDALWKRRGAQLDFNKLFAV